MCTEHVPRLALTFLEEKPISIMQFQFNVILLRLMSGWSAFISVPPSPIHLTVLSFFSYCSKHSYYLSM